MIAYYLNALRNTMANILQRIFSFKEIKKDDPLFDLHFSMNFLYPLLISGLTGIILICIPQLHIMNLGVLLLWSMACISLGTALGFLFGFPRSGKSKSENDKASANTGRNRDPQPNTNLEEISDWLTKIIVGLSLVNAKSIGELIINISNRIELSLIPYTNDIAKNIGLPLVLGCLIIGFFYGYFYTRLYLQQAFNTSDKKLISEFFNNVISATASQTSSSDGPLLPSKEEKENAERIAGFIPPGKAEPTIMDKIHDLAADYDKTRYEMPSSPQRTKRMTEIASSMRQLGQAAFFMLPKLTASHLAGERLAAICILQMSFDSNYIDWLAERINLEKPFIAYHAASALYGRMLNTDMTERKRIRSAVQDAKSRLTYPEQGRDHVIGRILELE
jgi:uncharacterized protein YneF (UPF0154 family)